MTYYVLNITAYVLNVTIFVLNVTWFVLNIIAFWDYVFGWFWVCWIVGYPIRSGATRNSWSGFSTSLQSFERKYMGLLLYKYNQPAKNRNYYSINKTKSKIQPYSFRISQKSKEDFYLILPYPNTDSVRKVKIYKTLHPSVAIWKGELLFS